jgi:TonB family protein
MNHHTRMSEFLILVYLLLAQPTAVQPKNCRLSIRHGAVEVHGIRKSAAPPIDLLVAIETAARRKWRPPKDARRASITFVLDQRGRASNIKLAGSSGSAATDSAGITAVETAAFPRLPQGFTKLVLTLHFDSSLFSQRHIPIERD